MQCVLLAFPQAACMLNPYSKLTPLHAAFECSVAPFEGSVRAILDAAPEVASFKVQKQGWSSQRMLLHLCVETCASEAVTQLVMSANPARPNPKGQYARSSTHTHEATRHKAKRHGVAGLAWLNCGQHDVCSRSRAQSDSDARGCGP